MQEAHVGHRAAAVARDPRLVLAGEQAGGQRAPGGQAQADVVVQARELLLHLLAVEQVVLRLLHHRLVQVVAVGDVPRGADVGRRPFAGAPVERLALGDHVAHRVHGLLDGRVRVAAVAIDEVDVLQAEALQRPVDGLHQVLAVERVLAVDRDGVGQAPEELGGHRVVQARPAELLQRGPHHLFALAAGVGLGVVEEVHARVVGGGHHLDGGVGVHLVGVGHPGAERQFAHLQAGAAQSSILHCRSLQFVARVSTRRQASGHNSIPFLTLAFM